MGVVGEAFVRRISLEVKSGSSSTSGTYQYQLYHSKGWKPTHSGHRGAVSGIKSSSIEILDSPAKHKKKEQGNFFIELFKNEWPAHLTV